MSVDVWGEPVAADDSGSIEAWNSAWADTLHFVGDPFGRLTRAIESDGSFALGSIFCATYRILGGSRFDDPELLADLETSVARARSTRELAHLAAVRELAVGNFTAAATAWDRAAVDTHDLAAVRMAHDVYLHCGGAEGRLASSAAALDRWQRSDPGWGAVVGMHSFALEELGRFDEAEGLGWEALQTDPLDLWALHALAHVYEETEAQDKALSLLQSREDTWSRQDLLAVHIWWHLALRLIAGGRFDEVLDLYDRLVPAATTPFRLSDLASILWRLDLFGVEVGDRWDHLADSYAAGPAQHTCAFLDLHAALAYERVPNHPRATAFFAGIETTHSPAVNENDRTFLNVLHPLVNALRHGSEDPAAAVAALDRLGPDLHRIGGSVAQRHIITLTRDRWHQAFKETQ